MKISYRKSEARGFTLIEMIGVLAVIAILAALLIPKIFEAINNARINNATITAGTVKSAIADHYAKFGSLNVDGTATPPVPFTLPKLDFDQTLLSEAFIDKPFAVKIGDGNTTNRVVLTAGVASSATPQSEAASFDLDGVGLANDAGPVGTVVALAAIGGVLPNDAWELSKRMDGDNLSETTATAPDRRGRVKFEAPGGSGTTTVFIYLTHR